MDISEADSEKIINKYISNMPSLSTTISMVLKVCNSPDTTANDLNRVISLDPVLTGNVLKLINSAFYSMRDRVTSLTKAIIMLGMNTIKNLAISTAILGTLNKAKSVKTSSIDAFWEHSICVGTAAKIIASMPELGLKNKDEFFVAGLLHDIGKIPLISCFPENYLLVEKAVHEEGVAIIRAENKFLNINHSQIGKKVAAKWGIAGSIYETICYHHFPFTIDVDNTQVVQIVALADVLAKTLGKKASNELTEEPDIVFNLNNTLLINMLDKMNIEYDSIAEIKETIVDELEKAKEFLHIAQKG
ncbi:MAG: HDOD domain-containing protein [Desulfobacteraceae bacterium]|nr:HDOD domain-containing protein [Desulfobacteraceae bacterium]